EQTRRIEGRYSYPEADYAGACGTAATFRSSGAAIHSLYAAKSSRTIAEGRLFDYRTRSSPRDKLSCEGSCGIGGQASRRRRHGKITISWVVIFPHCFVRT